MDFQVSVVIPLYNGASTLTDQLDALAKQTATGFEVVVADNGSTDGGPDIARAHPVGVRLVDASGWRGAAHARNVGAQAATADLLLFCDADDVVSPGWVDAMAQALAHFDMVGGYCDTKRLNGSRAAWRGPLVNPTVAVRPHPIAPSGNFGLHRKVLDALGGWDENLHGGGEDLVFCWRAQEAGFTLGYEPQAAVSVRFRGDIAAHVRQQYVYGRQLARIRRDFGVADAPPSVWRTGAWLVRNIGMLRGVAAGRWLGIAADRLGQVAGSRSSRPSRFAGWRRGRPRR